MKYKNKANVAKFIKIMTQSKKGKVMKYLYKKKIVIKKKMLQKLQTI